MDSISLAEWGWGFGEGSIALEGALGRIDGGNGLGELLSGRFRIDSRSLDSHIWDSSYFQNISEGLK